MEIYKRKSLTIETIEIDYFPQETCLKWHVCYLINALTNNIMPHKKVIDYGVYDNDKMVTIMTSITFLFIKCY